MIRCELCGGPLMVRPGGKEARCQSCGLLYPMEELKKMLPAGEAPDAVSPEPEARRSGPAPDAQVLAYFDYLFHGAFPDWAIRREVPAAELGGEAWQAPVNFLFSRNGKNVLAVCICDRDKWANKPFRGTEQTVQQAGITYMRFIEQFSNKPEYVIPRVSKVLYPDGVYL